MKQSHSKPALTATKQLLAANSLRQCEMLQQPKRDHYPQNQQPKRDYYPKKLLESPVLKQGEVRAHNPTSPGAQLVPYNKTGRLQSCQQG